MPETKRITKTEKANTLYRNAQFDRASIDQEARTVDLAFSSEEPVDRWFGTEILDHSPSSVRLGRLNDGGPILMDHDTRDHVGISVSASIDKDRRGRLVARFGNSARAKEVFQDVVDGIRHSVSVGYRIYKAVLETQSDNGDIYRVMDWEPLEVSLVSVPADATVGIGRAAGDEYEFEIELPQQEKRDMPEENKPATPAAERKPEIDPDKVRAEGGTAERKRINQILAIGERHEMKDLAREFINSDRSVAEFNEAVLERMGNKAEKPVDPVHVDMSDREHDEYSIVRALRAVTTGEWGRAGLEREVSDTIAKQLGRDTDGVFVPTALRMSGDLMKRTSLEAGTANIGGDTVATELMPMIDLLRNRMLVKQMGATVLSGLQGDLAFPRQTAAGTLYWVGETPGSDVTESNQTFDQVTMTPKTAQATTAYSRQLLNQSSLDVEAFMRNDLMAICALGLDIAAINGSGTSNQPTGILNTSGIGDVAGGTNGAAPTWGNIVDLESDVAIANADVGKMGYLTNAAVRGKLKQTEKATSTGQFVWGDGMASDPGFGELNGYRAGVSNQVPSNLTKGTSSGVCSAIIFGNWGDLMIGEWGVIEMIVDPYAQKKQGLIEVTPIMMVDIAVRHAESFSAMQDALTA